MVFFAQNFWNIYISRWSFNCFILFQNFNLKLFLVGVLTVLFVQNFNLKLFFVPGGQSPDSGGVTLHPGLAATSGVLRGSRNISLHQRVSQSIIAHNQMWKACFISPMIIFTKSLLVLVWNPFSEILNGTKI